MNALVLSRFSTMVGIDHRAKRMELIIAHLLGLAYARYVLKVEPLASLPVEQIIALSVPVVQHYMAHRGSPHASVDLTSSAGRPPGSPD